MAPSQTARRVPGPEDVEEESALDILVIEFGGAFPPYEELVKKFCNA